MNAQQNTHTRAHARTHARTHTHTHTHTQEIIEPKVVANKNQYRDFSKLI